MASLIQCDAWEQHLGKPRTEKLCSLLQDQYARLVSPEDGQPDVPFQKGGGRDTVPNFFAVRRRNIIRRAILYILEGKSPCGLCSPALHVLLYGHFLS